MKESEICRAICEALMFNRVPADDALFEMVRWTMERYSNALFTESMEVTGE